MANPHPSNSIKPGETRNPNGRPPKGHSITETIREMMTEKPEIKKALGTKVIQLALDGDLTAIRTIWGYLDGMPGQIQINTQINLTEMGVEFVDDQSKIT